MSEPVVGRIEFDRTPISILEQICPDAFAEVNSVLERGAVKHDGEFESGERRDTAFEILRAEAHEENYVDGVEIDHETGCHILAHVATRYMMALQNELTKDK